MTHHYPDLGSASVSKFPTWHDQSEALPRFCSDTSSDGISPLVSQTSFGGETSGGVAKCRLSSQADLKLLNSVCESNEMVSCLKQGSEINNFCFKQAQGLKSSVAHLYPNVP